MASQGLRCVHDKMRLLTQSLEELGDDIKPVIIMPSVLSECNDTLHALCEGGGGGGKSDRRVAHLDVSGVQRSSSVLQVRYCDDWISPKVSSRAV